MAGMSSPTRQAFRTVAAGPGGSPGGMGRIALFLPNLGGGGAERSFLALAAALSERGYEVDLVLCRAAGSLLSEAASLARIIELKPASSWSARVHALRADPKGLRAMLRPVLLPIKAPYALPYLPSLIGYLQQAAPTALLSAMTGSNLVAVWARRLADVPTRVVVSEHSILSIASRAAKHGSARLLPPLIARSYPAADAIVAVSHGVADDLAETGSISDERITVIYNPIVDPELFQGFAEPVDHPWFAPNAPPVVLGVGRLKPQKDFPTLIRAFRRVRERRDARLMILGEAARPAKTARRQAELVALAGELGVADDVALPGFVRNPFAYMARSSVFVLSSAWEGFGNVVVEALACGCPVVSTNCPSGPAEILENGRFGTLVPVGDDAAMAEAIMATLDNPPDPDALRARADFFSVDRAVESYLKVLLGQTKNQRTRALAGAGDGAWTGARSQCRLGS